MDPARFDQLSKRVATGRLSRRRAVRGLGAAGLAGTLFTLRRGHAAADCADITRCEMDCNTCDSVIPDFPFPGGPVGTCWNWGYLSCFPCSGKTLDDLRTICNQANSGCLGHCYARF